MATATVYHGATVTLNGKNYGVVVGSPKSYTIASVTKALEVDNVTAIASGGAGTTLFTVSATEGGNTLTTVKYLEVTNNEASTTAVITVIDSGAKQFSVEIPAGESKVVLLSDDIDANATGGGAGVGTLTEITSVQAEGTGATASVSFLALGT